MNISENNIAQANAFIPNSRLTWVGKERDVESNIGDFDTSVHGVRKYEPSAGRFLSIDPLWENYFIWTPYQYCGNNPVNSKDINGKVPEIYENDVQLLYRQTGGNDEALR